MLFRSPQAYDLLVTDYNMPGFCGVDLVREARLIRPDLPVALASGYVTAEIEQAALAEGAQARGHLGDQHGVHANFFGQAHHVHARRTACADVK